MLRLLLYLLPFSFFLSGAFLSVAFLSVAFLSVAIVPLSFADDALSLDQLLSEGDDSAEVLDAVVAAIDGDPVTWSALRRFVGTEGLEQPKTRDSLRQLIEKMIISSLLVKEAEKAGMSVSDAEVDAYLERVRQDNGATEEEFEQVLHQRGITREEYSAYVRQDILKARVLSKEIRSKIHVVDEDVQRYIAERPELKPAEGTLRLHEISFSKEGSDAAKLKEALGAISTLNEFRELGRNSYKDLGYVKLSELRDELAQTLLGLEGGGVTDLIEDSVGLRAYLVSSPVVTGDLVIDESLKAEVREKIFQVRYKEELDRFLEKELPKRYHVELAL